MKYVNCANALKEYFTVADSCLFKGGGKSNMAGSVEKEDLL